MGSLALPSQRQNMNTVPFVNRPLLSNHVPCVRLPPQMCVRRDGILGMLAEKNGMSLGMCVRACVCVGAVVCTCLSGGQVMSQEPCPNISCRYICLNVWWHPAGIRHVPARSCQRRARNALPEHNCPNTSPSAVSPHSCQGEITSHGFIYLFYHAPDQRLASALSCVSPAAGGTVKA